MTTKQGLKMKQALSALRRGVVASMAMAGLLSGVGPAMAQDRSRLPVIERIRHGDLRAPELSADGRTMTITQTTPVAKIDWKSFHIHGDHAVRIVQPDETAFIVNRVLGAEASQIDGRLSANGRVFIVNPQGIAVGGGAELYAAGIVLSTLGVTDQAMTSMAPVLDLSGQGAVLAQGGTIRVKDGGVLTLVSGEEMYQVGTLSAPSGAIHLAAAERVVLNASGRLADVSGAFQRLQHAGILSASNGEVSIVAGGNDHRPLEVGGTVEASGAGRIALRSTGPHLDLSGKLQPGRSLLIDEGVWDVTNESAQGSLASSVLETWLNEGVDVEFRRIVHGSLALTSDINVQSTASGKLTVRGDVEVRAAIHMGAGHLEFRDGDVEQSAPISAPGGSITMAGTAAELHQIHADRFTIGTPADVQFRARDKVQDGSRIARADDVKISGVTMVEGSNLRLVPSFEFDAAEEGLRYVAPSLEITGFNGDAKTSIPARGHAHARILPKEPTMPQPQPQPQPELKPQPQPQPGVNPDVTAPEVTVTVRPSVLPLAARLARDCALQATPRRAACDDHQPEDEDQIVRAGARLATGGIRLPADAQPARPSR